MDFEEIERKWQERWLRERIYEARRKNGKKFFIHFAYPGISGYLHVGHMRGFTYSDIIARYMRMQGYDVLFPAGFHATGLPAVSLAKKVERGDKATIEYLRKNGCPEEVIKKLSDPLEVVKFFSNVYVEEYWKKFGFLIDYTRLMDTISPGYKKFIQWQFHKLKEAGLLTTKPHFAPYCPNCGPVAVDKSETDISQGGDAEILEFVMLKFRMGEYILPAATLRPETIFGVTNMWVNDDAEYVIIKFGDEKWIVSRKAAEKLSYQFDGIEIVGKISGKEIAGKTCITPLINREVPIFGAKFVDEDVATGIVMSVPAHAPYDYIALRDIGMPIEPIVIIDIEGYEMPAKDIVEKMGIKSQMEKEKLEEATQVIYKEEFHKGILNKNCGEYAGKRIAEIKDEIKERLLDSKLAEVMREFSKKVICRCGAEVMIKRIPDQWFIRYSDEELTEKSKEHVKKMNIYPEEYRDELPKVLDWFGDRACIRQGSWLGPEFPFKKGWVIEPISDSTLYPAYYIISKYVNEGKITPDEMSIEFFDYVFLGKGTAKNDIWKEIRKEFNYWYPVDINLGGKEHKTVHFPVFIMNHVAIMPSQFWPRGIFVHWWVTQKKGEKISKSKGGAEPIPGATKKFGVDSMRLYYSHAGSPFVDIEWDGKTVEQYKNRLIKIWNMFETISLMNGEEREIDRWLEASFNKKLLEAIDAMKRFELRKASNAIYFDIYSIFQWYIKRGGNSITAKRYMEKWIISMTPFTPHIAEEMWERIGKKGFVSLEKYPVPEKIDEKVLIGEELLIRTVEDIEEIKKVTGLRPSRIYIYIAPPWKWELVKIAGMLKKEGKLDMKYLMKEAKKMDIDMKLASKYASQLINEMKKREFEIIDEAEYLRNAKEFIEKETGAEVHIMEKPEYDPQGKAKFAMPLKPAIYVE